MKLNLTVEMKTLIGEPLMMELASGVKRPLTMRDVCCESLLASRKDEDVKMLDKLHRWTLATKIWETKESEIEISPEDAVLIKEQVNKTFTTTVVGQVCLLLA